jgi:UDP-N-acetylglucosamine 2-epimerase (non-hydrolysing)
MTELLAVVGARPNFVKMAPLLAALEERGAAVRLLHTGQHYDRALSDGLIERLGMRTPDANLGVGSGSHAEQTAAVMIGVEKELESGAFDGMVAGGDVNSTMAAALAAVKLHVPVVHLESGLRSRDWTMPEEINRVVTDRVSDVLLVTSEDGVENLRAEGAPDSAIELVGNTMIDSLLRILDGVDRGSVLAEQDVERHRFALVTLHRPALVDDPEKLEAAMAVLGELAARMPVLFPAHPRTTGRLEAAGISMAEGMRILEPMDYAEFIALESEARLVITDSGGVQEETSVLGVPCLTYRDSTERPVTVQQGTNKLVGVDPGALRAAFEAELESQEPGPAPQIPLWDGKAGPRAADAVLAHLP